MGYGYEEYSEMGFDDLSDDYDDDYDDDYEDNHQYETEDTWFYEWRGHYSYDKPTLFQKAAWLLDDFRRFVYWKMKGYEDIPF